MLLLVVSLLALPIGSIIVAFDQIEYFGAALTADYNNNNNIMNMMNMMIGRSCSCGVVVEEQQQQQQQQQHRAEVREIVEGGDVDLLYEWGIRKGCSAAFIGPNCHAIDNNSRELVELNQTAENICDQTMGQNTNFGILSENYSNIIDKMTKIGPIIIEQLKKEEEIQNAQNAREAKASQSKFGTDLKAFSEELPEGRGKKALIELLEAKVPFLPSELLNMLVNKLIALEKHFENGKTQRGLKRRNKRMAMAPVIGGFLLLLALMCQAFGNDLAACLTALAFIELYGF